MDNISDKTSLKKVCVTRKGKKYYYPKTIPRERTPMANTYLICSSLTLVAHLCLTNERARLISAYMFSLLGYFFLNLTMRLILIGHEKAHIVTRYSGEISKLVRAAFTFNTPSIVAFGVCALYAVYFWSSFGIPSLAQIDYWYFILGFLCFADKLFDMNSNPISDSLWISKDNGLDYGSGMAYSFFYGYLNYILPKTGDAMKNLQEMMQDYEDSNEIKFELYKIFILIPKSLTCPVNINQASKLIEMRSSLADKVITVAGVRNRVYRNSVYTIKHEKTRTEVYVCTEYATPLKTFKEVVKNSTPHTEFYNHHANDILLQFYLTLKKILEREHIDSMCELVYYEDMDENNKFHDVGRILLDRIVEIKKQQ